MVWISYRGDAPNTQVDECEWLSIPMPVMRHKSKWPFLIADDGSPCYHANLYLLEEPIFKGCTEETLRTYAESLSSFLTLLEKKQEKFELVSSYDLIGYREEMRSSETKKLSPKTINLRIGVIDNFYKWLDRRFPGLSPRNLREPISLGLKNISNDEVSASHTTPKLKTYDTVSRIPSSIDALDFIAHMPEPYDLMAKWQLLTGLRSSGIRLLSLCDVKNSRQCSNSVFKLKIKEKPDKPRFIYPPNFLVSETKAYINGIRKIGKRKTLNIQLNRSGEELVFLNDRGFGITKQVYCDNFSRVSKMVDLKVIPHMFRSTYASMMLVVLRRLEFEGMHINPLLVVRELLGHSWMSTTEKYLKNVDVEIAIDGLFSESKESFFSEVVKHHNENMNGQ